MARELASRPTLADTTPLQSCTRDITLEDVEWMKRHITEHGLDTAIGVDGFSYKDCLDIPNEILLEFFLYCIKVPQYWLTMLLIGILKKDKEAKPAEPSLDSSRCIASLVWLASPSGVKLPVQAVPTLSSLHTSGSERTIENFTTHDIIRFEHAVSELETASDDSESETDSDGLRSTLTKRKAPAQALFELLLFTPI
ncbi:hypothetical protein B0H13DRAFT_2310238 [Mycena leptocephala]|nr:hypothetical protein B0H13DRAFT_2310238 [Mycena leptocephala]